MKGRNLSFTVADGSAEGFPNLIAESLGRPSDVRLLRYTCDPGCNEGDAHIPLGLESVIAT